MAADPLAEAPPIEVAIEAIPEGMVVDFLTGDLRRDTPEEYVRQNLERALVRQYGFAQTDCVPEFPIRVGSSRRRLDIAVFAPGEEHVQENVRTIVETKQPATPIEHAREGIGQLESYLAACLNARYGIWTNGDDRLCLAKRQEGDRQRYERILDIPAAGQSEADAQRPRRRDLKPATADNLLFAFRRSHNYIAGNEGMHKQAAFWELLKLIFTKIEDERSRALSFFVTPAELTNSTSAQGAKARIQQLFTNRVVRKHQSIFANPDSQHIQLKPHTVAYVVGQLQRFSLLSSPVDVKGRAYEEVVGSNLRGDRGEFFTPRNACRMAVTMLNPQPSERLIDPACGTGGFLITAMNHARDLLDRTERLEWVDPEGSDAEREELFRAHQEYVRERVIGLDLNPELVRAAKMNMVMNNDGAVGLHQANSLDNPHTWAVSAAGSAPLASFEVLVTNPPFGANIPIEAPEILRQYDLAARWDLADEGRWEMRVAADGEPVLQKSQPPEILFIERCWQLLRPGTGRMAMVVPNGILNNPALGYIRQWLLDRTQILAVVDMARELFQPKNDTQTSMLIVRRFGDTEVAEQHAGGRDYPCFMAVAEKVGHDRRGSPLYRRNERGEDIVSVRREFVPELDPVSGEERVREIQVKELVLDDELPEVATAYRRWLGQQR